MIPVDWYVCLKIQCKSQLSGVDQRYPDFRTCQYCHGNGCKYSAMQLSRQSGAAAYSSEACNLTTLAYSESDQDDNSGLGDRVNGRLLVLLLFLRYNHNQMLSGLVSPYIANSCGRKGKQCFGRQSGIYHSSFWPTSLEQSACRRICSHVVANIPLQSLCSCE
jgi:hypothetical protein